MCKLKVNQKNTFLYSVDEGFGRIDGTNFNKIRLFIAHPLRNHMPYQTDKNQPNSPYPDFRIDPEGKEKAAKKAQGRDYSRIETKLLWH